MSMEWMKGNTLSSKHKDFRWKFTNEEGLVIKRIFKDEVEHTTIFSVVDIENLMNYVFKREKTELANNVQKLHDGTEKEGLGKFVYEELGRNEEDAQATSQLAAIFVHAKIFDWNGTSRNMEFWIKNIDWRERLKNCNEKSYVFEPLRIEINHITYSVDDLEKSIRFYEDAFGARIQAKGERLAYFDLDGIWLALNVEKGIDRQAISQSYTHIAFTVSDLELDKVIDRLNYYKITYEEGRSRNEREGKSIYLRDPDGHLFEFHTKKRSERLAFYKEERKDIVIYEVDGL